MFCKHFGLCGSCKFDDYELQLNNKIDSTLESFKEFVDRDSLEVIESKKINFRSRIEFRIFRDGDKLKLAMFDRDKKIFPIDECLIVESEISSIFKPLIKELEDSKVLKERLFAVEFLNGKKLLVTLIYHKKLTQNWIEEAKELENRLNISIIGRSRKQKEILSRDYIENNVNLDSKILKYQFLEGSFTQPNNYINQKMLNWVYSKIPNSKRDLLELYCGAGNFTIALSQKFRKTLATEISKTAIKSAVKNIDLNDGAGDIEFLRMSSEEFNDAIDKKREFFRVKEKNLDLDSYDFDTIFVDPPRAGLDELTRNLSKRYDTIIYISCNQDTLRRDLESISQTHRVEHFAIFDQFPYTNHIETALILKKI